MKQQQRTYWCGPAALQNALRALGRKVSQKRIAELCDTTENGTTEFGLMQGVRELGLNFVEFNGDWKENARKFLDMYTPTILCIDSWQHWVACIGKSNERYVVIDPARTKSNLAEHLISVMTWPTIERKWRAAARVQTDPNDRTYYALAIR